MKKLLAPIVHATRSFLGINGLTPRIMEINSRLVDLDHRIAAAEASLALSSNGLEQWMARVEAALPKPARDSDVPVMMLGYVALTGDPPTPTGPPTVIKGGSRLCRQGDFATDAFRYWSAAIRQPVSMQRKIWEWYFLADALFQRDCLRPGRSGITFGVGREPLPALFATMGCNIMATDMSLEAAHKTGWSDTMQHADEMKWLNERGICDPATFNERVRFRVVDMNDIPIDLDGQFDFCWSSCALEHLGSLEHGMRFVQESMRVLKPGGIGVHTTEFNMSSDTETFESRHLSLFRRRDLQALTARLERVGHRVEAFDWNQGHGYADGYVDLPPYFATPVEQHMHLRLRIADFDCTSIGMICHKGQDHAT